MLKLTPASHVRPPRPVLVGLLLVATSFAGDRLMATTAKAPSREAEWLGAYVRLGSPEAAGGARGAEARAAAWLGQQLATAGVAHRLIVSPTGRVSVYARLAPTLPSSGGDIVLLHHMDVVAAGPGWTVPPFGGEIHQGRLFGRGAIDCKGLGVAHLSAFLDLARRRVPLERGLVLLAVADEETGGLEGAGYLWERHADLFADVDLVLNEGGGNRVVAGRPLWWAIEIAQKRPLWLEVETAAVGGHAANLRPASAVHQLLRALARLVERPLSYRVSPIVRQVLRQQAPLQNDFARPVYERIDDHVTPQGPRRPEGWPPGLANLLLDTVQVTVLEGAPQINIIATKARAQIDARLLPDTDSDEFLAQLRATLGDDATVRVLLSEPPSAPSPTESALFRRLAAALEPTAPVVPAMTSGFTDSRFFRRRGIAAYGFSPFLLAGEDGPGIHGPDESLSLATLDAGVATMRRVVESLVLARPEAGAADR